MSSLIRTEAVSAVANKYCDGLSGEFAPFPKRDWKQEVAEDETILGYFEWVVVKALAAGARIEDLV
jgi:hypothetical protein